MKLSSADKFTLGVATYCFIMGAWHISTKQYQWAMLQFMLSAINLLMLLHFRSKHKYLYR